MIGTLRAGKVAPLDAIYKVASLTKPVTTMTTLKLVNAGVWDLDAPIHEFFTDPDLAEHPQLKLLTTRHILSHRSGLPNWRYLTKSGKLTFDFEPGSRQQYSGEGFEILRKALEAKLKMPLEALADTWLFKPLGMKDTSFTWNAAVTDENYAVPHDGRGRLLEEKKHDQANAAANLLTTASDYGKFLAHVVSGAGLSSELYKEMVTPTAHPDGDLPWGLGWQVIDGMTDRQFALQHTGGDFGLKSIAVIFPKTGDGLLVFSNSENGMVLWKKILEESFTADGQTLARRNLR